jgi:hypothetical protein
MDILERGDIFFLYRPRVDRGPPTEPLTTGEWR